MLFCFFIQSLLEAREYITGNAFRQCADYHVENFQHSFDPEQIQPKSIIYIEVDSLGYFFTDVFPKLQVPVILISHNGDHPAPGQYAEYLDDPNIIVWFGQNCDCLPHQKFIPIPIGIANPRWPHGNQAIFDEVLACLATHSHKKRFSKVYINFSAGTHPIRARLLKLFKNKSYVFVAGVKALKEYLQEMAQYTFVLSPRGNGLDCHRTWEALLVGTIPVVETSTLDPLYEDLPVIILQSWDELSPQMLKQKYHEIKTKFVNRDTLYMEYWIERIKNYQK
jgi:hypothetical protein